jgi:hypothetical protein
MNFGILATLNSILQKIQQDAVVVGLTMASLMIVIYSILILFDTDTSVTAHTKRWDNLRKVFFLAFFITAAGALVSFGQLLGSMLHA